MAMKESWLRCRSVTQGMLAGEYTVVTMTSEGKEISMFAPETLVRPDKGLMRVTVLDVGGGSALVYLPVIPLETSSRTVKVPERELISL